MNSTFMRLILLTIITLMLSILPAPAILSGFRPPWVCLLVLYLQCFYPRYFHLSFILVLGLCLDILLSSIMGEHVFALLFVSWLANAKARRFQFFPMGQQMALIGFFCLIYQCVITSIDAFLGFNYVLWTPMVSALVAVCFWPWLQFLGNYALISGLMVRKKRNLILD